MRLKSLVIAGAVAVVLAGCGQTQSLSEATMVAGTSGAERAVPASVSPTSTGMPVATTQATPVTPPAPESPASAAASKGSTVPQGGAAGGSSTGTRFSESEEWKRLGSKILEGEYQAIAEQRAHVPSAVEPGADKNAVSSSPSGTGGSTGENLYAYLSDPVDIIGDGQYTIKFRVPGSFAIQPTGRAPMHFGFNFPRDTDFQIHPNGAVSLERAPDGTTFFVVPMGVTDFKSPYRRFTIWTY